MSNCDVDGCGAPIRFRLYATYNADHGENTHPLHARYPVAMYRACPEHVGVLALGDAMLPLCTNQWLVVRIADE